MWEVRSGCVGGSREFIPGPVDLHELPGINLQTGDGQFIHYVKGCRQEPLFPVLFELPDDIFDVIFIDQDVVFHDGFHGLPFCCTVQDLLLVMEGDLGIRDKEGWERCMGNQTFRTTHTLERKPDKDRVKLNRTFVTAITDERSYFSAGTLDLVELETISHAVIIRLREIIASFKDNCYHKVGKGTKEDSSWCCQ